MVGPGRFERPTSPLSGVRSNRLSYGPEPGDNGHLEGCADGAPEACAPMGAVVVASPKTGLSTMSCPQRS
jgi:hypothetical protein